MTTKTESISQNAHLEVIYDSMYHYIPYLKKKNSSTKSKSAFYVTLSHLSQAQ